MRRRCRRHCTAPSWRTASAARCETQTTATSSPIAYTVAVGARPA
ncbi:hypothetical protein ASZ90_009937 [hydrocarbon metagenome]|uniref:Uncharacterized protein n=1 Tax=hydrocarbon metagenome TaxID=938273 RepID=A0A0W8FHE1_9ZZZZ